MFEILHKFMMRVLTNQEARNRKGLLEIPFCYFFGFLVPPLAMFYNEKYHIYL